MQLEKQNPVPLVAQPVLLRVPFGRENHTGPVLSQGHYRDIPYPLSFSGGSEPASATALTGTDEGIGNEQERAA